MASSTEAVKFHRLFLTETPTLIMMSKVASILWASSVLKKHDAVIAKISSNIIYMPPSFAWWTASSRPHFGSSIEIKLGPPWQGHLSRLDQDSSGRRAVWGPDRLWADVQNFHLPRGLQQGRELLPNFHLTFPARGGKGRSLKGNSSPSQLQVGSVFGQLWEVFRVEVLHSGY